MVTNMHIPELEVAHGSLKREYPQSHKASTVQLFRESMTFLGQGKKVSRFLGLAWPGVTVWREHLFVVMRELEVQR